MTSHAAIRPYSVFNGNNFPGLASNGTATPPDSTGAVGPSYYVEMVNSTIGVRLLGSSGFTTSDLATFGAKNTSDCAFDPQISWDQQGGRWLYSFDDQVPVGNCGTISTNYVAFGWSKTSNPSDLVNGWCRFVIPTGTDFFDYDKLGHDNNFINIGANVFANSGNGVFETAVIVSINKPARGSTACTQPSKLVFFGSPGAPLRNADNSVAFTPVPAITTDSFGAGYIVASHAAPANKVMVWHVTSSSGTPVLTADGDISVATYGVPPNIPQPVTGATSCATIGNCLDSLDGRLTQAVVRYDPAARRETIWTQHAVHDALVGTLSVERWYELIPGLNTGPRQTGTVSDPALYIFNGAISPSLAGNEAIIFYNAGNGSAGGFASVRAQSRNTLTALNTMTTETLIASSTVNDNDFSCGVNRTPTPTVAPCRWGDYSAARPDSADMNVVWGTSMLTGTGGTSTSAGWSTQFAAYTPGCATASVTGPGSGSAGDIIPLTASSTGCNTPRYQFWLRYPNGSFALKQAFGSSNGWNWDTAGYAAGDYNIYLWANQAGDSANNWESFGTTLVHLAAPVHCSSGGLTPANPSVPAGSTINFTATASGCSTPVFEYWVQDPKGTWTIKRAFNTTPTFGWDTTGLVPGTYTVHVWANQRGDSTSTFETFGSTTVTLSGCTSASLNPSTVAQPAGAPVNFTASSVGCLNPLYEFWVGYPNGTWVMKQAWGGPNFSLITAGLSPGMYSVHVWANQAGASLATWEANGAASVALNICTSAALNPTSQSAPAGSMVPLSATSTDCLSPQYEYWAQYPNGTWHLARSFGAAAFNWNTAGLAPGIYNIHVWANNIGDSTATWEAYGVGTVTLTGCTSASVTPSPASPKPVGTPVTFTATSSGCTAIPVYEFWLQYPNGTWVMKQLFSIGTTWQWNTTNLPTGTYNIHVWANNQGADTSTYETFGTATFTLT